MRALAIVTTTVWLLAAATRSEAGPAAVKGDWESGSLLMRLASGRDLDELRLSGLTERDIWALRIFADRALGEVSAARARWSVRDDKRELQFSVSLQFAVDDFLVSFVQVLAASDHQQDITSALDRHFLTVLECVHARDVSAIGRLSEHLSIAHQRLNVVQVAKLRVNRGGGTDFEKKWAKWSATYDSGVALAALAALDTQMDTTADRLRVATLMQCLGSISVNAPDGMECRPILLGAP